MDRFREKRRKRIRRHRHIRRRLIGTPERPRLAVFRSLRHVYVQVINDISGRTLAAASTQTPSIRQALNGGGGNKEAAGAVGKRIAELALEKGIKEVCFDRGGYKYHGRVKALADAAREAGLIF